MVSLDHTIWFLFLYAELWILERLDWRISFYTPPKRFHSLKIYFFAYTAPSGEAAWRLSWREDAGMWNTRFAAQTELVQAVAVKVPYSIQANWRHLKNILPSYVCVVQFGILDYVFVPWRYAKSTLKFPQFNDCNQANFIFFVPKKHHSIFFVQAYKAMLFFRQNSRDNQ